MMYLIYLRYKISIQLIVDKGIYNETNERFDRWIRLHEKYQENFTGLSTWFRNYSCSIFHNYFDLKIKLYNDDINQKNVMIVFKHDYPNYSGFDDRENTFRLI